MRPARGQQCRDTEVVEESAGQALDVVADGRDVVDGLVCGVVQSPFEADADTLAKQGSACCAGPAEAAETVTAKEPAVAGSCC